MEKLAELLKDKAFAAELMKQATAEDAQKFIASKGVEVSIEDLQSIRAEILKQEQTGDELNDDQLENVAGGFNFNPLITITKTLIQEVPSLIKEFKTLKW